MASASKLGLSLFVPRPHAHWTPRYLWCRARQELWIRSHPEDPWLTRTAVAFLAEFVRPGDTVVEFGSGRSTMWFARKVGAQGRVVSVEGSQDWQIEISKRLDSAGLRHAEVEFAPHNPDEYVASAARRVQNRTAEVILVDGFARDACASWALSAVKAGGVIVVDNVQHYLPHASQCPLAIPVDGTPRTPLWSEFQHRTAAWRKFWTTDGVNDTAIFFAPTNH